LPNEKSYEWFEKRRKTKCLELAYEEKRKAFGTVSALLFIHHLLSRAWNNRSTFKD
jgi:hypothetical protein